MGSVVENPVVDLEIIRERARSYLLPKEIRDDYPAPAYFDRRAKEKAEKFKPGASFVVSSYEGQLTIVPIDHPAYRQTPEINHRGEYGSGIFEGLSALPVVDADGQIVGANIILLDERMKRLQTSLRSRGMQDMVDVDKLRQAIIDIVAVNAEGILWDAQRGKPSRAYIRPSIGPGDGPLGVGIKPGLHEIMQSVVAFNWPDYLDSEKALSIGLTAVVCPRWQRLNPITGKNSSNYGDAGVVGNEAREVGDEALYLAPYVEVESDSGERERRHILAQAGQKERRLLMRYGVLADGPGEGVIAITRDGKIFYPPGDEDETKSVNQLRSTTLHYVVEHLAPKLELECEERAFTLEDIRRGKIVGLCYVGNAAKITPIGRIALFSDLPSQVGSPEELIEIGVSELARQLASRFEDEINGRVKPAHPSLLTPVSLEAGKIMKEELRAGYPGWS